MTDENDKIVVGLDIGSTKVCAVAGRLIRNNKNQEMLEVLGVGEVPLTDGVNKGSVVNVGNTVHAIGRAVKDVSAQSNLDVHSVNVSFSGAHVTSTKTTHSITRSSAGDEIQRKDINRLLSDMYKTGVASDKEIVHVFPIDFTVDSESNINQPVGRNGIKLGADFQIITANTSSTTNIRRCIQRNHLEQETIMLSSLASSLAVLTDEEKYAGVALVDIGGGTTELAIYNGNVLRHVAVFPWAGNNVTADIQAGCKILPNQAETLKKRFGKALPNDINLNEVVAVPGINAGRPKDVLLKNVALIIEDRLREIAALVQSEIIRAGFEGKLLGGIVLTGGSASTPGIENVFARVMGLSSDEVRVGYPEHLEPNGRADLVGDPAYATAVGLVWAGYKNIDNRITFITDPSKNSSVDTGLEPEPNPTADDRSGPAAGGTQKPQKTADEPKSGGWWDWLMDWTKPIRGSEKDGY